LDTLTLPYLGFYGYFTVKMEALQFAETSVIIKHTKMRTEDLTLQELYYDGKGKDQDVDGRIILRWIFRKLEGVVGTGCWFRIGIGGGHLWVR